MSLIGRVFLPLIALVFMSNLALAADKRVALIIGNSEYTHTGNLSNPGNDARAMAKLLTDMGFTLVKGQALLNQSKSQFDDAVSKFGDLAQGAQVALFYYSGHGLQINGTNYLVPSDAPPLTTSNFRTHYINASMIMDTATESRSSLKFFLLDACRNNPFNNKKSFGSSGLAEMPAPTGTLISFASQPGTLADDGQAGGNSPYTEALLKSLRQPGRDPFRVINEAALEVVRKTKGEQQPWMAASAIDGSFYFTPPLANVVNTPATPAVASVMPAAAPLPVVPAPYPVSLTGPVPVMLDYIQDANREFQKLDYAMGRQILTQGIETAGQKTAIMFSYRGFSWLQDGNNTKDSDKALSMYRAGFNDLDTAIKLEGTYPTSYRHRGNMIMATYRLLKVTRRSTNRILDNAVKDLQNAAALDPTSAFNAYFLGEAYNLRGEGQDFEKAVSWFEKAIELNSKYVAPHSGLCYAYRMMGKRASAEEKAAYAAKRDDQQQDKSCLKREAWARYVPKF
ncbi:MAG: peptidase [Candidatus Adlerbacteria bacterium]|nr:peptidase [Candidatus Adlerbacteria bacterium]